MAITEPTISGFEQIYQGMLAGILPYHEEDVFQSILYAASNILSTDKVHVGWYRSGASAYYFAAPSSLFGSVLDFATPLVAAVPGHPSHRGDGAYVITQGKISVAAISANQSFRLMCNETELILEHLADLGLNVYYPEATVSPLAIESAHGRMRRLGDQFSRRVVKVAAIGSAIAFTVAAAASFAETAFNTTVSDANDQNATELNKLVGSLEYSSPLSQQVGEINKLSATVVRAGGWIDAYSVKKGNTSFTVTLPEWVTQDYIKALGDGAVADKDAESNTIKVVQK